MNTPMTHTMHNPLDRSDSPRLAFACELDNRSLQDLFTDESLMDQLLELRARVVLGILDFSPERADVIRRLNKRNIPVTAWLLLPESQGYWFNLDNAHHARRRYREFLHWSTSLGLQWESIGIDIEPDIAFIKAFQQGTSTGIRKLLSRTRSSRRHSARGQYLSLFAEMRADGFLIESYQFPFIADERIARSKTLQKWTGILDFKADREVFMLYSSFMRPYGPGLIASYGPQTNAIGLGSTGGGVDLNGVADTRPLTWLEFEQDLLLASRISDELFIFSLEGCVQQGFLDLISNLDWYKTSYLNLPQYRRIERLRTLFRSFLWIASHPGLLLAGVGLLTWLIARRRKP